MRNFFFLFILGLLTAFLMGTASAETSSAEARSRFEEALRLLAAKETDRALVELKRAIELDETYPEANLEFIEHTLQKEEIRSALIAQYRQKVEAHPNSPIFHYLLGFLLKGEEREKEFRRSVELKPNFFWGHLSLFESYLSEPEKSDAELKLASASCPETGYAHASLALSLFRANMLDEAIAEFEKAKVLGVDEHLSEVVGASLKQIPGIRTFNLIYFSAYLIAALICTAFFVWELKAGLRKPSLSRKDLVELFFGLFCCLWFYLLFFQSAKGTNGFFIWRGFEIERLLVLFCNAFWPALVYHMYFIDRSGQIQLHKVYRWFLAYFYASGIVLTGDFIAAFIAYKSSRLELFEFLLRWGMFTFLGNFIICAILVFIRGIKVNRAMRAAQEEPEARTSRQWHIFMWALWLFVFWPVIIAAIFGVITLREYGKYLDLFGTLMPLAFILVSVYYKARYAFVDLFIKKGAVVIVTTLIAAFYYVYVVESFAGISFWKYVKYPAVLILLPLIAAIPILARGVEKAIDRYVFGRKSNPAESLSSFSRAIRFVSNEEQLLEIAKSYLTEIFFTKNVIVFFAPQFEEARFPIPGIEEELQRAGGSVLSNGIQIPETADCCRQNAIEVIVPLIVEEKIRGCIALGKRHYREPYLSEDLRLLNSLADQLESALENLDLERDRREQELKEKELKVLASRAELRALRAQINPHFLFNALNTIASLIRKSPAKAEETVETLADVFRYTLAKSGADFIPLAEEIDFVKSYLEVEKARFGSKLQIEIKVDPQAESVKIPPMLLQPLVENAVKHGISPKMEGGKITISATCENGLLKLAVADDGMGFDSSNSQRLYKDGVGVKNVHDRLVAIYGNEESFQIHSVPNVGTEISIAIPVRAVEL